MCTSSVMLTFGAALEPPLPSWDPDERKELEAAGWIAGAVLLTGDPIEENQPQTEAPLTLELPNPEEISGDHEPITEVAENYLEAYFAARPGKFLIDPQGLLSEAAFRDRLAFLDYHAGDSSIDLFVYLIGGDQEIPSEVRQEEMVERFFSEGRPAAVVYYYLGAPQRSVVYLSPSLTDSISAPEQHRALESSIIQAFEKTDPAEQFERFLVQMSIRIYWMERKVGGQSISSDSMGEPVSAALVAAKAQEKPMKFEALRRKVLEFFIPGMVLIGAVLSGMAMRQWSRWKSRYRFPDFEVEPRLGGSHAAGVGAVISFASAAQPPASQRDQVPDYLRRA
ncbi:MAG: hypothetical protein V4640_07590 [Verrucomicrobiota bacterium]